jgi:hypothetical protein
LPAIEGGEKLKASLDRLAKKVSKPAELKVGFLASATYPDGQSVAEVAFWNNFGTATIPPRPFFSNMVMEKSKEWPRALGDLLKANDYDAVKTLEIAGKAIEGQLQQSIKDTNEPPLAQSTIDAKGFDKPLIDSAVMINSVASEVKS